MLDRCGFPLQQASKRVKANLAGLKHAGKEDKLITSIASDVLSAGKYVASHPLGV